MIEFGALCELARREDHSNTKTENREKTNQFRRAGRF
jgi:hypothetical protein